MRYSWPALSVYGDILTYSLQMFVLVHVNDSVRTGQAEWLHGAPKFRGLCVQTIHFANLVLTLIDVLTSGQFVWHICILHEHLCRVTRRKRSWHLCALVSNAVWQYGAVKVNSEG